MPAVAEREFLSFKSSVLLIGHPNPDQVAFGADFATTPHDAFEKLSKTLYPVVVSYVDTLSTSEQTAFFKEATVRSPDSRHVLVTTDQNPTALLNLLELVRVSKVLKSHTEAEFDQAVQEALEEYMLARQNQMLLHLIREQNQQLTTLSQQLEERVEKRQKYLVQAHKKLVVATRKSEALQRALVAIHRAGNITEMERLVNEALQLALKLSWTRIIFSAQNHLELLIERERSNYTILGIPILNDSAKVGHIYFARNAKFPFKREETDFLLQISEGISLAIGRLTALQLSEEIKRQWEATFNAITVPVSLMTSQFDLVRVNQAFASKAKRSPEALVGKKCYEALFNRKDPCETCKLGYKFRIHQRDKAKNPLTIYDVSSQNIAFEKDFFTYVNIYRDVSEQLKMERQMVESAKMAELGTIGSSIAHELNNPIGGIITFLQLIKMDLKGSEPFFIDIGEMEQAAQRCREIIQNLLSFTRKSQADSKQDVDLKEVIRKAVQILELQSRSMGVKLEIELPKDSAIIHGNMNLLSHALMNLLQTSVDGVLKQMRENISYSGVIRIRLHATKENYTIEINDNRPGLRPAEAAPVASFGLRQTVAAQIISELGGTLEISSGTTTDDSARIALPRPVF
jgi:two-component system, NtrC family, sensor kinase